MKNKILKGVTWLSGVMSVLAISSYDSNSKLSALILCICLAWIVPVIVANKELLHD